MRYLVLQRLRGSFGRTGRWQGLGYRCRLHRQRLLRGLLGNEGQKLLVGHFANRELDGSALRAGDFGLFGRVKALELADRLISQKCGVARLPLGGLGPLAGSWRQAAN